MAASGLGSFFPIILELRRRIDQALYALKMEAWVNGVSTRAVDDPVAALGIGTGISKSEVSRICAPDSTLLISTVVVAAVLLVSLAVAIVQARRMLVLRRTLLTSPDNPPLEDAGTLRAARRRDSARCTRRVQRRPGRAGRLPRLLIAPASVWSAVRARDRSRHNDSRPGQIHTGQVAFSRWSRLRRYVTLCASCSCSYAATASAGSSSSNGVRQSPARSFARTTRSAAASCTAVRGG